MPSVHLISGLGADRNAFSALGNFTQMSINFIEWIPNVKNELLSSYATRLIRSYNIGKEDIIVGLSFGGLVALEIAKTLNLEKVILISSFRDKQDLKPIFESFLNFGLHRLIPNFKLHPMNSFIRRMFNTSSQEGRLVLNKMLETTDMQLTKWSIQKINESTFERATGMQTKIYNLIGDSDKLVKTWTNEQTIVVKDGGHFMVFENANEISEILKSILKTSLE